MAWIPTGNRDREFRRKRQPEVEQLDARRLLSTGLGANLSKQVAASRLDLAAQRPRAVAAQVAMTPLKAQAQARIAAIGGADEGAMARGHVPKLGARLAGASLERPAGTIATGAPTAFDPIIGAAETRQTYNIDGAGLTVAVIDTGVDYNNPALGGGFGPNARVIAGFNFANGSGDPMTTTSTHGTAVTSLIAGSDPDHLGVAPGADIVALKVTGENNAADLSKIAGALQWVIDHHAEYNISVVNMSLSDGLNFARNWKVEDAGIGQHVTELVQRLKALNIPVVAATGNSFTGAQGHGFSSVIEGVISVTATDPNDAILPKAQRLGEEYGRGSATKIAAPGSGIMALNGGGYSTVEGTSFAAPLVSGSVVLLQQMYLSTHGKLPTVDEVTGWLQQGATQIKDPVTGIELGRLDLLKSAALVPGASPQTQPSAPTPQPQIVDPPPIPVDYGTTPTDDAPAPEPVETPAPAPVDEAPAPEPVETPAAPVDKTQAPEPVETPAAPVDETPAPSLSPIGFPAPRYMMPLYLNGKPVKGVDQATSNSTLARAEAGQLLRALSKWANSSNGSKITNPIRAWTTSSK